MTRQISIDGRVFGSPAVVDVAGCQWLFDSIAGWGGDGVSVRRKSVPNLLGDGDFNIKSSRGGRLVAFAGNVLCPSRAAAAQVELSLSALLADGDAADLTVTDDDLPTMSSSVGLADAPTVDWSHGTTVRFAFELFAPDPLRYGSPVSLTASFPTTGGGLRTPLFTNGTIGVGYLDFGVPGTSGRVTLANPGTADARLQFEVTGPVADEGFDIVCVETGERLTFASGVAAGSSILLDSATGRVLLNGDSDRSGYLTVAQWFGVPAGQSRTIAFLPRGTTSAASLRSMILPAWW